MHYYFKIRTKQGHTNTIILIVWVFLIEHLPEFYQNIEMSRMLVYLQLLFLSR